MPRLTISRTTKSPSKGAPADGFLAGYRSGSEGYFGEELKLLGQDKGIRVEYETEQLYYTLRCRYTPDFVLTFPRGHKRYLEWKGRLEDQDRRKMAEVKAQRPDLDLRIIFERPREANRLTRPKAKSTNADWCAKHGIPWATGDIPENWLLEPLETTGVH